MEWQGVHPPWEKCEFAQNIPRIAFTGFEHTMQFLSDLQKEGCPLETPRSVFNKGEKNSNPQGFEHARWPKGGSG